jgi:hypothetical protein
MHLVLDRQFAVGDATIGTLSIDGKFHCFTLEDVIREKKVFAKTAIPAGAYHVYLCESPKFSDKYEKLGRGRIVPLIADVPGYKGIRIHCGNKASHSEGCVLVGYYWDKKSAYIDKTHEAFKGLMAKLKGSGKHLRITIRNSIGNTDGKLMHPTPELFDGLFGFLANHKVPGLAHPG